MNRKALEETLDRPARRRRPAPAAAPAAPAAEPPAPAAPAGARPDRKLRLTFDLIGAEYRDFARWREDAADQLARQRVTAQDVCRLLVRHLLDNPELQRDILAGLAAELGGGPAS